MIITATPYRISFFGGGTDYRAWYEQHGGAVLSTTINRYCYLQCRYLPPFFDHKHRIVWSRIETPNDSNEIEHPAVREAINYLGISEGLEIHHFGDLPARAGLGSSSSFSVGLLHALHSLRGALVNKETLARQAIHLEQALIKEAVGVQDQIAAAYGGLNLIKIQRNGLFDVQPIPLTEERLNALEARLLLVYTGISRSASDIAKKQIAAVPKKTAVLSRMREIVDEGAAILAKADALSDFGHLLHESWELKREITPEITTSLVEEVYARSRAAGALGGKLLGAGGGGFMLLFVEPEDREAVVDALEDLLVIPFRTERAGTRIVAYEPNGYAFDR
ncbi:MAG: kinase [Kiloniellales bacterium]|nr:kinase [Kiloniellales bacterium]